MGWDCCPASHLLLHARLLILPTFTSHCAFFSIYAAWCVREGKVTHRAPKSWGTLHWAQLFYGVLPSTCLPTPGQLAQKAPQRCGGGRWGGSAWSGGCAAFAIAGNLTCKSRQEGCLGTTLGRWYRRTVWQPKFSINGMYYWTEIKKKKKKVGRR